MDDAVGSVVRSEPIVTTDCVANGVELCELSRRIALDPMELRNYSFVDSRIQLREGAKSISGNCSSNIRG